MAERTTLAATVLILGGKRLTAKPLRSRLDLVPLVRRGLPYAALESVAEHLSLSIDATALSLGLSKRTLARRKEEGALDAVESERIVRLAEIAARASEVFGDDALAKTWLAEPNRALGDIAPLALLDTDVGADAVRDVLGRVEHGVFS